MMISNHRGNTDAQPEILRERAHRSPRWHPPAGRELRRSPRLRRLASASVVSTLRAITPIYIIKFDVRDLLRRTLDVRDQAVPLGAPYRTY